jgi:hypothetical protein
VRAKVGDFASTPRRRLMRFGQRVRLRLFGCQAHMFVGNADLDDDLRPWFIASSGPPSRCCRRCDSVARTTAPRVRAWGHSGDGIYRDCDVVSVEQVRWWRRRESSKLASPKGGAACLTTPPKPSERSERWWRRRESNPRPKANTRETLHAYPLLFSRARREEAAQNRQAPDPVNLAVRRRAAV